MPFDLLRNVVLSRRAGFLLLLVLVCVIGAASTVEDSSQDSLPDTTIMSDQSENEHRVGSWQDKLQVLQKAASQVVPRYYESLQEWPVLTKSSTAFFIGGLGDMLAQFIEINVLGSTPRYHLYRALSVALEGLFVSGPLMHYSYEFLDSVIPVESEDASDSEKWTMAALQVLLDCLIMNCIYVATLMVTTAILEGRSHQIGAELKLEYWNGVKASWANSLFFAPMQCYLFRYVPLMYRVLAMNLQDVVWNASVSYVAHRSRKDDDTKVKTE